MSEFYLTDLSEKDKPWDLHRGEADQVRDLYQEVGYSGYGDRVETCAKWLAFALVATDEGERQFRLQSARFCRVRHCPICQWRRSLMWKARFRKALPAIVESYPTARWVFLTLTVKNCPLGELRETITLMNQSFIRLSKLKAFPAIGWVKSLEVTRQLVSTPNGSGSDEQYYAHPHFHVLMMVPSTYFKSTRYVKQEKWRELWQKCLRADYEPWVDVRIVKAKRGATKDEALLPILSGLKEVLKYTVKGDDLTSDPGWLMGLTQQLHKTRTLSVGGCLRSYLSEAEPDEGDLIHGDDEPEQVAEDDPRFDFYWAEKMKRYRGSARGQ